MFNCIFVPTVAGYLLIYVQDSVFDNNEPHRQTTNISRTLVGNMIVDYLVGNMIVHHSGVVGASPVGSVPTTSSFSTEHLASMDWATAIARQDTFEFLDLVRLMLETWWYIFQSRVAHFVLHSSLLQPDWLIWKQGNFVMRWTWQTKCVGQVN